MATTTLTVQKRSIDDPTEVREIEKGQARHRHLTTVRAVPSCEEHGLDRLTVEAAGTHLGPERRRGLSPRQRRSVGTRLGLGAVHVGCAQEPGRKAEGVSAQTTWVA